MTIAAELDKLKKTCHPAQVIAVSKRQPPARIEAALAAGQRVFGENYLQEAAEKWPAWRQQYPDIELHFIGALQRNKAKQVIGLFDYIHTLDRLSLAETLATLQQQGHTLPKLFIQINMGLEAQKAGLPPQEAAAFHQQCQTLHLPVVGLMCLPPPAAPAGLHFGLLQTLARDLRLSQLSMGTSHDYQTALEFGATHVRLGTLIFGQRLS